MSDEILIVEDNELVRDLLRGIFKNSSARLKFVASGEEAIDESQLNIYDLMLVDISLPGINGVKKFHQIRSILNLPAFCKLKSQMKYSHNFIF